jgi:predicted metallopeptidase
MAASKRDQLREYVDAIWGLVYDYGPPTPAESNIQSAVDIFIEKGDYEQAYILSVLVAVNRLDCAPAMDILASHAALAARTIERIGNGHADG